MRHDGSPVLDPANATGYIPWPDRLAEDTKASPVEVPAQGLVIGLVVTASVAAFVVLLVLIALLVRKHLPGNVKFIDLDLDNDNHITTSRSAPSTRSSSPHGKRERRRSSLHKTDRETVVRSVTMESMPDLQLPSERVQPLTTNDMDRSAAVSSILQYQHHLLGHLSPDMNTSFRSSEGESDAEDLMSPGFLYYSVYYDPACETLCVHVVKAEHLRGRGCENATRDPFIKVYLLPDEKACQQSRVIKGSLSPVFKEDFTFVVPVNEVRSKTLRLSVYDVDRRRMRHALGHAFVPLCDIDLSSRQVYCRELDNDSKTSSGLGELYVSLCYNGQKEKLKIIVVRGRDLRKLDFDNDQSVYIKAQLLYGQRHQKTKKSASIAARNDPNFNEAFSFSLSCKQLDSCSLRLSVMLVGQGNDREYGEIRLGSYMHARGEALLHWQEMISNYRQPVVRWHLLSAAHVSSLTSLNNNAK